MSLSGSTILVTGAAGFIGSHVAEALLARGAEVVGLDNLDDYYDPSLKRANLESVDEAARRAGVSFRFVESDIRDEHAIGALFDRERFEGVIHLAARAGVRPSIAQPALYASVNVTGTTVLLEAARRAECGRFVCASSSSVYGNNPKTPFAEVDAVDHPISPYAATKKACELIGHTYHHLYGMQVAMLRFFTVFGPRQRPDLAISLFLNRVSRGEPITVFGDGSMSRDYTFIDDIVGGVLAAYERIPAHGFRVWNLGGHRPVTLSRMIEAIEATVGKKAKIERRPAPPGDVERTWADLTRSSAELDFIPRVNLEQGLERQFQWMTTSAALKVR